MCWWNAREQFDCLFPFLFLRFLLAPTQVLSAATLQSSSYTKISAWAIGCWLQLRFPSLLLQHLTALQNLYMRPCPQALTSIHSHLATCSLWGPNSKPKSLGVSHWFQSVFVQAFDEQGTRGRKIREQIIHKRRLTDKERGEASGQEKDS